MNTAKYLWVIAICLLTLRLAFHFFAITNIRDGMNIRVSGKVSIEPYKYDYSQSVYLNGYYTYLPLYPEISYGDRVVIEGQVKDNKLLDPKLISLIKNQSPLLKFRTSLLKVYQNSLPQDHAALVAGMTIGSKGSLTQDFREKLKMTGTAHVVVASGMNVALVAGFLINLLVGFMQRRKALVTAFVGIWTYSVLAGFDAPIIRAAIMASLTFSAQQVGRMNYAWRTLFVTLFLMLMVKPEWLTDLGFLLSASATASLMLFEEKMRSKVMFVPKYIREDLSTTLAAQVLVVPLLLLYFGRYNILSPIINALVLWTVPLITTIGMLAGVVGVIFFPLGKIMLLMIYPLTWWFVWVVEIFS